MDWLADNNFGDTRSGGLAGPMGLLIIIVLGVVTVFLIRNMSKRIKRLPSTFDGSVDVPEAPAARPDGGPPARTGDPDMVEQAKNSPENLP